VEHEPDVAPGLDPAPARVNCESGVDNWRKCSRKGTHRLFEYNLCWQHYEFLERKALWELEFNIGYRAQVKSKLSTVSGVSLENGYVYFAGIRDVRIVKIGYSQFPKGRVAAISRGSSLLGGAPKGRAYVITTIPGTRATEKSLHMEYMDYHISGEWFHLRGKLALYLRGNKDGR